MQAHRARAGDVGGSCVSRMGEHDGLPREPGTWYDGGCRQNTNRSQNRQIWRPRTPPVTSQALENKREKGNS